MANTANNAGSSRRSALRAPTPAFEDDNPPLPTGEIPIPHHPFGSAYLPSFLRDWGYSDADRTKLAHLNCSFFSHPTNPLPPTLLQLKQHAQAICCLLQILCASDHEYAPPPIDENGSVTDAFDWLEDLDHTYDNNSQTHNLPLYSLSNTIATHTAADGSVTRLTGCPFAQTEPENETMVRLVEHANSLLELIDHKVQPQGGLLSLLPPPGTEEREAVQDTILGQWLVYTTNLVQRVSELEAEVANAREVLAGEAMVPMRLVSQGMDTVGDVIAAGRADGGARTGAEGLGGRVMVFPQDRYVLANCGAGLWERLNEDLAAREQELEARERERGRTLRGGTVRGQPGAGHVLQPVTYMDVQSRIYRVKGCQSLFVIPAFDIHPDTEGTRRIETKGLVQTVVRPLEYALGDTDRWQRTVVERARTAEQQGRSAARRARSLKEEVAGLRLELEERTQELERERARGREVRATERDLASKEEHVRAQMEMMRDERLRLGLDRVGLEREGVGAEAGPAAAAGRRGVRSESAQEVLDAVKKGTGKKGTGRKGTGKKGTGNSGVGKSGAGKKGTGLRGKPRVLVEVETDDEEEE